MISGSLYYRKLAKKSGTYVRNDVNLKHHFNNKKGLSSMESISFTKTNLKPVIKWVGGKRQLLDELYFLKPKSYHRYFEPFIGGGALLFSLAPERATINDANSDLILMYNVIRDNPKELLAVLEKHAASNSKEYYYKIRALDRDGTLSNLSDIEKVARLIFMLKVDFNGLYRVNSKGEFNVPYGRYKNPKIANEENICAVSDYFNNNEIKMLTGDYSTATESAKKDDFVYFDPPYIPLTETASFTSYTKEGFGLVQQEQLRDRFNDLSAKGVNVMLSNSDTPLTRELYKDANIHEAQASRSINSVASKRGKVSELIITSY